jgi:hypothetical protein
MRTSSAPSHRLPPASTSGCRSCAPRSQMPPPSIRSTSRYRASPPGRGCSAIRQAGRPHRGPLASHRAGHIMVCYSFDVSDAVMKNLQQQICRHGAARAPLPSWPTTRALDLVFVAYGEMAAGWLCQLAWRREELGPRDSRSGDGRLAVVTGTVGYHN